MLCECTTVLLVCGIQNSVIPSQKYPRFTRDYLEIIGFYNKEKETRKDPCDEKLKLSRKVSVFILSMPKLYSIFQVSVLPFQNFAFYYLF